MSILNDIGFVAAAAAAGDYYDFIIMNIQTV